MLEDRQTALRTAEKLLPILTERIETSADLRQTALRLHETINELMHNADPRTCAGLIRIETSLLESMQTIFRRFSAASRDPQTAAKELLQHDSFCKPEFSAWPTALAVTLPEDEFRGFWRSKNFIFNHTTGSTLSCDFVPSDLRGHLVVINPGDGAGGLRSEASVAATLKHELIHSIFRTLYARSDLITVPDLANALLALDPGTDPFAHRIIADKLVLSLQERTRNEIIAYVCTGDLVISPESYEAGMWPAMIEQVKAYLSCHPETDPRESERILDLYSSEYRDYQIQTENYLNAAVNIYRHYGDWEQAAALLLTTSLEEFDLLPVPGVRPGLRPAA